MRGLWNLASLQELINVKCGLYHTWSWEIPTGSKEIFDPSWRQEQSKSMPACWFSFFRWCFSDNISLIEMSSRHPWAVHFGTDGYCWHMCSDTSSNLSSFFGLDPASVPFSVSSGRDPENGWDIWETEKTTCSWGDGFSPGLTYIFFRFLSQRKTCNFDNFRTNTFTTYFHTDIFPLITLLTCRCQNSLF